MFNFHTKNYVIGFCDNYKMADNRNVNVVEKIAIKLLVKPLLFFIPHINCRSLIIIIVKIKGSGKHYYGKYSVALDKLKIKASGKHCYGILWLMAKR